MNQANSRRRLLGALCAAPLVATARKVRAQAAAARLRIGVSLALSGVHQPDGAMQAKGYRLWAQQLAQRGGVLGRSVDLIVRDDRSEADTAVRIYEEFFDREGVDFVFGPFSSGITLAVAPLAERRGHPMLAAGAAADELWRRGYRHVFGTIPAASRQSIGYLALLADAGINTLAIVETTDAYAVDLATGARRWAAPYGVRIASTQQVARGLPDLVPVARAARESGAGAVLMAGHFDESVGMRRALAAIRWTPRAFFASVGPTQDRFAHILGEEAEGVLASSTWEPREELRFPGSAAFLRDFVAAYRETPSFLAAQAYAAGQILEQAIVRAGRTDRAAVRDALAGLDTEVITGRYAVDASGLLVRRFPLIVQWQGGRREIVWPPELRTAPVRFGA